jgi:hypothetical protein
LEGEAGSSEEELVQPASPSEGEEEEEGVFAFRRKRGCQYYAVSDYTLPSVIAGVVSAVRSLTRLFLTLT